jgi:hypothetical protein
MGAPKILVVAWINGNARTEDLGLWLGAEVRFMPWAWPGLAVPRRVLSWVRSAVATATVLRRLRPDTVIVIEPPVFAPLVAWAARRRRCRLFLDLHSGALIAPNWRWARPLLGFVARRADGIIVTNRETLEGFDLGATPAYVLHDPLWARGDGEPAHADRTGGAEPYVLFPASGSTDEPFELIEQVGRRLGGRPVVKVSGKVARPPAPGVAYVGYLPREEYDELLRGASAVLSLTDWEATMQRSAYEAVHAGVPVVALDRRVLREAFHDGGAVFARADADDIARAVTEALEHRAQLAADTARARARLREGSEVVKQVLLG